MAFKIESGVPLPPNAGKQGLGKYPFRKMNIGDSFLVATDVQGKTANNLASCARQIFGKGNFAIRRVEGGVRVWRLA